MSLEKTPKSLHCWLSKEEKNPAGGRERWMNRPTFILAAIGSAIGLGNFWRFPYLTYKHDGGPFFFPYLMCLFLMGIPLLLMELGLGQKFQRGDISVFRGIHPRLAGIGLASVFSAYIITFYYNVIISWSLVYFVSAFKSPLPWSKDIEDFDRRGCCQGDECKALALELGEDVTEKSRAEIFFNNDVIRFYNDQCLPYADGDPTQFSVYAFIAVLFVWLSCFLAIFKGVKSSSYIVWITVPLPVVLIIVMVFKGLSLEGHEQGIKQYLGGNPDKYLDVIPGSDKWNEIKADEERIWGDAAGQIFFSIGVCMGIMTSYGSYNDIRKPIIMDNLIISLCNSCLSFIAGFAVWSVVGYL